MNEIRKFLEGRADSESLELLKAHGMTPPTQTSRKDAMGAMVWLLARSGDTRAIKTAKEYMLDYSGWQAGDVQC